MVEGKILQKKDGSGTFNKKIVTIIDINGDSTTIQFFDKNIDVIATLRVNDVIEFHGVLMCEYNALRYLRFNSSTTIEINPSNNVVDLLKEKFAQMTIENAPLMKLAEALEKLNENALFRFSTTIEILDVDDSHVYKQCPSDNCSRKLNEENDMFHCDKCKKTFTIYGTHALFKVRFFSMLLKQF